LPSSSPRARTIRTRQQADADSRGERGQAGSGGVKVRQAIQAQCYFLAAAPSPKAKVKQAMGIHCVRRSFRENLRPILMHFEAFDRCLGCEEKTTLMKQTSWALV
jgi:hypothetical protein